MDANTQRLAQLAQYIQKQQRQGRADAVIRNELAQGGWSETVIDDAFQLIWQQANSQPYTPGVGLPPVSPTGALPGGPSKLKRIVIAAVVILVTILAFIAAVVALSGASVQQNSQETQRQLEAATQQARKDQANADNGQRESDVRAIASGTREYLELHSSLYPQTIGQGEEADTLKLCGETCDTTSVSVSLDFYKPADVSVKSYSSGLAKPEREEVFIVTNALCNKDRTGVELPVNQSPAQTIAFLFAKQADSGVTRHCAPL